MVFKQSIKHYHEYFNHFGFLKGKGFENNFATNFFTSPLSSNIGAEIDGLYKDITKAEFNDYRVFTILSEETKDFLEGRASAG